MDHNIENKTCSFCGRRGRAGENFAGGLGAMMCGECLDFYHAAYHDPKALAEGSLPPWERMSDAEILGNVPLISQTADQVAAFLVEWVDLARSRKISWSEIGKSMGVSRQAAWERFAQRVETLRLGSTGA